MALAKAGQALPPPVMDLLIGRMSGTMGVTSALLILIGGIYLYYTKTANRASIVTVIAVYAILNEVLHQFGVGHIYGALPSVLGAGFLFGAFFMVTDPVSSPSTQEARILYAALIAVLAVVIRNFSVFNGGLMFAILLGNMFGPILDYAVKSYKKKKTAVPAGKEAS